MNREEALGRLQLTDPLVRLDAARALLDSARVEDRAEIRRALRTESDRWVRRALSLVLSRLGAPPRAGEADVLDRPHDADALADVRADAIETTTRILLHEIGTALGGIAAAAFREHPAYEGSDLQKAIGAMRRVLASLSELNLSATTPLAVDEFDAGELVLDVISGIGKSAVAVQVAGPRPCPMAGAEKHIRLVIRNGLTNALESEAMAIGSSLAPKPIVNWGTTDTEHWIAILDEGIGLPEGGGRLFDVGITSKRSDGHLGMGLTIARQAAQALGGSVTLVQRRPLGAEFELRWPRPGGGR